MKQNAKKLRLEKTNLKTLAVRSGVRTGVDGPPQSNPVSVGCNLSASTCGCTFDKCGRLAQ
jgi:hypothetical protein